MAASSSSRGDRTTRDILSRLPAVASPEESERREAPALLSIVVPAHNESGNVCVLADAVSTSLGDQPYELIFVDDGSSDDTFARLRELSARDNRVCAVSLSRNFGHQYALAAGLIIARGDAVVTMDADMQHPPSLLPQLIDKWRGGANIVHTVRQDTRDVGLFKRVASRLFYRVFSLLSGVPIDPGMADYRLLDRRVVDEVNALKEGTLLLRAVFMWMGYQTAVVPFVVEKRHAGQTSYTVRKMFQLAMNGLLSFSTIPLRIGLILGIGTAFAAFLEFMYVMYVVFFTHDLVPGWASTVASTTLLFGMLFIMLGVQGQYLLRLYELARERPAFIVERIVRQSEQSEP